MKEIYLDNAATTKVDAKKSGEALVEEIKGTDLSHHTPNFQKILGSETSEAISEITPE